MNSHNINEAFAALSTAVIADACYRLQITVQVAPVGIRAVTTKEHIAGRALPVQHVGSVDVFLDAMSSAQMGDVLVIDNGGRMDEGCVGDLTILEAQSSGLSGVMVWGCHRDTVALKNILFPVFSYGSCPAGPKRPGVHDRPELKAQFGGFPVEHGDLVFADPDGVCFVPYSSGLRIDKLLSVAIEIQRTEQRQIEVQRSGTSLREQLRFSEYVAQRALDPEYSFRVHLRKIGGAVEE